MALPHCLQGRERSSLHFYLYFLAGMDISSLCNTFLNIVHATHPALTGMGKHPYTGLAGKFLCGCGVCNSLLSLLQYVLYIVISDVVCILEWENTNWSGLYVIWCIYRNLARFSGICLEFIQPYFPLHVVALLSFPGSPHIWREAAWYIL